MKRQIKLLIYLMICCFIAPECIAQQLSPTLSFKEKAYAKTILEIANYLRSQPTPVKSFDSLSPVADSFYQKIINKHFDRERMQIEYSKNTDHFAVEGKIDILRLVMNISDRWLDYIPLDSIFIISAKDHNYFEEEQVDELENSLMVVFGSDKIFLLAIWFDRASGKIISVGPGGMTDKQRLQVQKYFIPVSRAKKLNPI